MRSHVCRVASKTQEDKVRKWETRGGWDWESGFEIPFVWSTNKAQGVFSRWLVKWSVSSVFQTSQRFLHLNICGEHLTWQVDAALWQGLLATDIDECVWVCFWPCVCVYLYVCVSVSTKIQFCDAGSQEGLSLLLGQDGIEGLSPLLSVSDEPVIWRAIQRERMQYIQRQRESCLRHRNSAQKRLCYILYDIRLIANCLCLNLPCCRVSWYTNILCFFCSIMPA